MLYLRKKKIDVKKITKKIKFSVYRWKKLKKFATKSLLKFLDTNAVYLNTNELKVMTVLNCF